MKSVMTIKGQPIIEVYESFDGSYRFATEKAWKQDSLIHGKIFKNDQIFFGYVRLSSCPQFAEFGYFSEAEVKQLGKWVWKVPRRDWSGCPEVEIQNIAEGEVELAGGRETQPGPSIPTHTSVRRWIENGN